MSQTFPLAETRLPARRLLLGDVIRVVCLFLTVITTLPAAEDIVRWNRFHGPNGTGVAHHVAFPDAWNIDDYAWRIELPGRGVSSPVVWTHDGTERVFAQGGSADGNTRYLRCIDANTGDTVWEREQSYPSPKMHKRNSLGSSTPSVDASGVYVVFGDGNQYALTKYDHDGERIWQKQLGAFICNHGGAFSPVVIGERVICSLQQPPNEDRDAQVATVLHSFDRMTGQAGWQSTMTANEKASFSAPCLRELGGGNSEIVCANTGDGLFAVNPETGHTNWSLPVFKMRCVSSPVLAGELVLGSTGSGGGGNYVAAVKPGPRHEVEEAWRVTQQAPYVPTSVYHDGLVFLWSDKGIVTCVDATSGTELWKERAAGATGASPICVGDRLVGVTETGDAVVLAASREFKKLGGGPLGESSQATPAVGVKQIYFRSDNHLMALGE